MPEANVTTTRPQAAAERHSRATRCFKSAAHPRGAPAALVYSRAMAAPLATTFTPLMLGALAAVLMEQRIWPHVFWAALLALAVAWGWARFQLSRTVAEVRIRPEGGRAAVRSARDVLREAEPAWQRVARLRVEREAWRIDLGDTSHRLPKDRWPEADALEQALRETTGR